MSFITENDIIDHTQRQIFYKEYLETSSPSQKSRLITLRLYIMFYGVMGHDDV